MAAGYETCSATGKGAPAVLHQAQRLRHTESLSGTWCLVGLSDRLPLDWMADHRGGHFARRAVLVRHAQPLHGGAVYGEAQGRERRSEFVARGPRYTIISPLE